MFSYLLKKLKTDLNQKRILLLGLDGAGKSTILEKTFGIKNTGPTFGYKIYKINNLNKTYNLEILDVGGQQIIRKYWSNFYENIDGLIFVFDLSDDRDFKNLLENIRNEINLIDTKFLIIGNKVDLVNNYEFKLQFCREYDFVAVSAKFNYGLKEAMDNFLAKI